MIPNAIRWRAGRLSILDQTLLPGECRYRDLDSVEAVWEAIKQLRVRGAPAIGVCAAFGVLVGLRGDGPATVDRVHAVADYLATSRPTAVNLFWALDRMRAAAADAGGDLPARLEREALAIEAEDQAMGDAIGEHGAALITEGMGVLTHCNAGALATSGSGTALSVFYAAHAAGRRFRVYADETRPLLQGARLTAWELVQAGIDTTVICDNMAAQVMREGRVQLVVVGADRIAANGDAANKIGTYGVAVLARAHNIPFYVAAPRSTFDLAIADGSGIPIEERDAEEITHAAGRRMAPEGARVYNPAFDVTPAGLIAGFITESGILQPPFRFADRAADRAAHC
jgi:methylthioribose-1-phosphate isomerase